MIWDCPWHIPTLDIYGLSMAASDNPSQAHTWSQRTPCCPTVTRSLPSHAIVRLVPWFRKYVAMRAANAFNLSMNSLRSHSFTPTLYPPGCSLSRSFSRLTYALALKVVFLQTSWVCFISHAKYALVWVLNWEHFDTIQEIGPKVRVGTHPRVRALPCNYRIKVPSYSKLVMVQQIHYHYT